MCVAGSSSLCECVRRKPWCVACFAPYNGVITYKHVIYVPCGTYRDTHNIIIGNIMRVPVFNNTFFNGAQEMGFLSLFLRLLPTASYLGCD